jgi:hypothetical protein
MLDFERHVVAALISSEEASVHAAVESFVDGTLRTMPEFLRLGVLGETVMLMTWARLRHGRQTSAAVSAVVAALDRSPIGLLRQYVRLFRSLVLFAELELETAPAS